MLTSDSSYADLQASKRIGAVLPIGALEQHGPHLALGTDTVTAEALARKIAEAFDYYLLPPLAYGCSREHLAFPGTVTLSNATLAAVVTDITESLRTQNFRYLVIVSGHGGNWILKPTLRELNLKAPNATKLILVDPESFYYPLLDRPGFHHAGEYETAIALHLRPQSVQMAHAKGLKHEPTFHRSMPDYLPIQNLLPKGVWGDPEQATPELGREYFEKAAAASIEHLRLILSQLEQFGNP